MARRASVVGVRSSVNGRRRSAYVRYRSVHGKHFLGFSGQAVSSGANPVAEICF